MKKWTRWQDWVAVAAGLVAAVAGIMMAPGMGMSMTMMIVLGVLMIAAGVWSLAAPGLVSMEWILAAIGALLFISPWIGSYAGDAGPAWTSWICGVVCAVAGLWALVPAEKAHRSSHGGPTAAHA